MEFFQTPFKLSELTIEKGDIELLMGYSPGESPEPFPEIIDEVYRQLLDHCSPEGGYTILDNPKFSLDENLTRVGGHVFKTDKIVTRMLRKSERLAIFVCTAGEGIGIWAKDANASGDPVRGFIIDTFGSQIAEATANKLHKIIGEEAGKTQKTISNRYSPGYCGWPVKNQQELFSFFPEKFCGISLSPSSLMYPIKSVSGFIGIGQEVGYQAYTCDSCNDKHCIFRRLRKKKPEPV